MPRLARVVVPGIPHHITQRGNRRQQVFFGDDDYRAYIEFMTSWCSKHRVEVWAYCLMPNHIHLIAMPKSEDGLRRGIGEAHRRYSLRVNSREGWKGHLWQDRFSSYPMDEPYLLVGARYIELNPVKAGIVEKPEAWRWSSAVAHITGKDDALVRAGPLREMVQQDWKSFLAQDMKTKQIEEIQKHERTGRPLGNKAFVEKLENLLSRVLSKQRPGPKPRKRRQN